jgi:hypothetical protein
LGVTQPGSLIPAPLDDGSPVRSGAPADNIQERRQWGGEAGHAAHMHSPPRHLTLEQQPSTRAPYSPLHRQLQLPVQALASEANERGDRSSVGGTGSRLAGWSTVAAYAAPSPSGLGHAHQYARPFAGFTSPPAVSSYYGLQAHV